GDGFFGDEAPADVGHHDAGVFGIHAEEEDRFVWFAGDDVVLAAAGAVAGGDGGCPDAELGGVGLVPTEVEAGGASRAGGVVAVGAVDVEPGAGPLVDGSGVRIVEAREGGDFFRVR